MKRPYVIAINAVSGGGKTALAKAVHQSLPSSALYCFDDFDESHVLPDDFYERWRRGADVAEFDFPGMYAAVCRKIEKNDREPRVKERKPPDDIGGDLRILRRKDDDTAGATAPTA